MPLDFDSKVNMLINTLTVTGKIRPETCIITSALCNAVIPLIRPEMNEKSRICATSGKISADVSVLTIHSTVGKHGDSQKERIETH